MLRLVIGNKAYSSWSLRGWLAVKQSGLPFEEVTVPLDGEEWEARYGDERFLRSGGKVPILTEGEVIVWDSFAILEWLADRTSPSRYWPEDEAARALARSMAAEMHSSFPNLRRLYPMNVRSSFPERPFRPEARADVERVASLWEMARSRHGSGGPYLFGAFGAADIMFAPVATRFATYSIALPDTAGAYRDAILDHPWMRDWIDAARKELWVLEDYEPPGA